MRLKYQLFLTLLLTGSILIALMAAIGRWNFERGFIGYINNTERQQLRPVVETLAQGYADAGNWQWITDHPDNWRVLLDTHLRTRKTPPDGGIRPGTPPSAQEPAGRAPPPPPAKRDGRDERTDRKPPGKIVGTLTMDPRLLLADKQKHLLIGRERPDSPPQWLPIVSNEQTVGFLGYHERRSLTGQLDKAFATQQRRSFFYTACAMALLSALLAVALASRLVRPILNVKDAVARIGRGQYTHRVTESRNDEIGDLSRSINTLAVSLEKNLDARRQWLAEISHELRTPVAILQGELEAIQDGVQTLDQKAIASLHVETLRLARLIDDLHDLTLSDIGALDYRFEPIEIRQVLAARINATHSQIEAASLRITIRPDISSSAGTLVVNADPQRLGQLFDNLLQNSIRYTHANGEVRIDMTSDNGGVIINWADSAPGVTDEQLTQLFEPLFRADASRNRSHGGAGLGLAIVQRIVDAHGGTIQARHSPLGGVALHIQMPLAQESAS